LAVLGLVLTFDDDGMVLHSFRWFEECGRLAEAAEVKRWEEVRRVPRIRLDLLANTGFSSNVVVRMSWTATSVSWRARFVSPNGSSMSWRTTFVSWTGRSLSWRAPELSRDEATDVLEVT
jgi:hypothetical protein